MDPFVIKISNIALFGLSIICTLGIFVSVVMLVVQLYNAYKYKEPLEDMDNELIPDRYIRKSLVFLLGNAVSLVFMMTLSKIALIASTSFTVVFVKISVISSIILLILVVTSKIVENNYQARKN